MTQLDDAIPERVQERLEEAKFLGPDFGGTRAEIAQVYQVATEAEEVKVLPLSHGGAHLVAYRDDWMDPQWAAMVPVLMEHVRPAGAKLRLVEAVRHEGETHTRELPNPNQKEER